MGEVAEERNQPPPGAEAVRKYTPEEKANLLEQFLLGKAGGESDHEIAERLGVSRANIYRWKAKLEQGGTLENDKPGRKTKVAAKKKKKKSTATNFTGRQGTPIATRVMAVQEHLRAPSRVIETAARYRVTASSIYAWVKDYKAGKFNAPGRAVNGHGQPAQVVMFEDPPQKPAAIQRAPLMRPEDTDLKMQLALAHAEIARLKQRNRKLAQLVGDDE